MGRFKVGIAMRRSRSVCAISWSLVWLVGCTAELGQSCFDGPCGEEANQIEVTIRDSGEYPVDVFAILRDNCHGCHGLPPNNGAPFSLQTVDDAEADFCDDPIDDPGGPCTPVEPSVPTWSAMAVAVEHGSAPPLNITPMPLNLPALPDESLEVLRAWFSTCEAGECERRVE